MMSVQILYLLGSLAVSIYIKNVLFYTNYSTNCNGEYSRNAVKFLNKQTKKILSKNATLQTPQWCVRVNLN